MIISLVGGPGTGKTVLGMDVTSILKKRGVVAGFAGEYARRWMAKHRKPRPETVGDQFCIYRGQVDLEDDFERTQDVLITDSSAWLCAMYATMLTRDRSDLIHTLDLTEKSLERLPRYTTTYLLPRCFGLQVEAGRCQSTAEEGERIDRRIRGFIELYNISVVELPEDHEAWPEIVAEDVMRVVQ